MPERELHRPLAYLGFPSTRRLYTRSSLTDKSYLQGSNAWPGRSWRYVEEELSLPSVGRESERTVVSDGAGPVSKSLLRRDPAWVVSTGREGQRRWGKCAWGSVSPTTPQKPPLVPPGFGKDAVPFCKRSQGGGCHRLVERESRFGH